jgi:hypothetical protein
MGGRPRGRAAPRTGVVTETETEIKTKIKKGRGRRAETSPGARYADVAPSAALATVAGKVEWGTVTVAGTVVQGAMEQG